MRGASGAVDGGFEYFEKYGSLRRIRCSEICACFCPTFDHQLRRDCLNAEGIWGAGGGREVSVETEGDEGRKGGEQEGRMANASLEGRRTGRIVKVWSGEYRSAAFIEAMPRVRHPLVVGIKWECFRALVTILNIIIHKPPCTTVLA